MLQAGIENLRQPDMLPQTLVRLNISEGTFSVYIYLLVRLLATALFNLCKELCIYAYVVAGNSLLSCSTHGIESIYT